MTVPIRLRTVAGTAAFVAGALAGASCAGEGGDGVERTLPPMQTFLTSVPRSSTTTTTVAPAVPSPATPAPTSGPASPITTVRTTSPAGPSSSNGPTTTTTVPAPFVLATRSGSSVEIGRSVEGRAIVAHRRGSPTGIPVVIIGVIHGNEDAGEAIVDRLLGATIPDGFDLWLVPTMNPDGQFADHRGNANRVDLNRNFPFNWGPIGRPGESQYAGPAAASEPETKAMMGFLLQLKPKMVMWYHQDLYRLAPATGLVGELTDRYAELTGLPIIRITGGTYTGVASTWATQTLPGTAAFIVELGASLSTGEEWMHADAVLEIIELLK